MEDFKNDQEESKIAARPTNIETEVPVHEDLQEVTRQLLEQINANEANAETYEHLLSLFPEKGKEQEEFLQTIGVIQALGASLQSYSTNTCANSLHAMAFFAKRSHKAREDCFDYIHIIIKLMRGPLILPYAIKLVQILILYEPQLVSKLVKQENIIEKLIDTASYQIDSHRIGYICSLINSLIKFYPSFTPTEYLVGKSINFFLGINYYDAEIITSVMTLFTTLLKNYDLYHMSIFNAEEVFNRLCFLTEQSQSWDPSWSVISRCLECWNVLVMKYSTLLFTEGGIVNMFRAIFSTFKHPCPIRSRYYFFLSNIAAIPEFAAIFMNEGLFDIVVQSANDMNINEKENFYFLVCNLVKTLGTGVCDHPHFGEMFVDCFAFAPSAHSLDFEALFLELVLVVYNYNSSFLDRVDMEDFSDYVDDVIFEGTAEGHNIALLVKQTLFPDQ